MKYNVLVRVGEWPLLILGYLILIGVIAYGFYGYKNLEKAYILSQEANEAFSRELENVERDNITLLETLEEKQTIIDSFSSQIRDISSTVGTLEKLAQTDKELLQKYSRVYFLNENYVPAKLASIEEKYLYQGSTNFLFHADVWPFLKRLLEAAHADGINLLIASAFRSFDTQASLKSNYRVIYGFGANQFSADQGYSEHQLGTAVDFTTPEIGAVFSRFGTSLAYEWLLNNAHHYGFILSYPEGNTYYKYEPWHWRFVGVELAGKLKEEGKYFYDLEQREIDSYLVKLFD
jgi:LAS superfamily LD-carboxypeptidase LdcB